jgi:hypothetical protein
LEQKIEIQVSIAEEKMVALHSLVGIKISKKQLLT